MKFILYLMTGLFLVSPYAKARPVSYPGGWTLMTMNDADANSTHIHYSPTFKYSIGWRHDYMRDESTHIDSVQLNNLIKRWNSKGEQANFYIKSGVGIAYEHGETAPAAFTGIALDWETRRYFTSYENRFLWTDDVGNSFVKHKGRVGIAPYIGDYGDLHTWLMLQIDYDAGQQDSFSATPLIRFFKDSTMLEAGYNLDDGIMLNFIQRF